MPADAKHFKAPFISQHDCWAAADEFRKKYWPSGDIPVDVLAIVEFDLGLEIRAISGLKEDADVDALLLGDWKTLIVDRQQYMDERFINRLRFSIAHELGHFTLHKAVFNSIPRSTAKEWISYMQEMPDKEYSLLEYHANEFAGRLLVPFDELKGEFNKAVHEAVNNGIPKGNLSDVYLPYLCINPAKFFAVSQEVIEKRLLKEKLWP